MIIVDLRSSSTVNIIRNEFDHRLGGSVYNLYARYFLQRQELNWLKMCYNLIKRHCKMFVATLALSVLFVSVIVRMVVTIKPGFNMTFSMPTLVLPVVLPEYGYWEPVTPSQVCCLCIWFSMTYLSCSLIREITSFTGFIEIVLAAFRDIPRNIALLSLHSYEIWMFGFIYKTYVVDFDYIFQVIIILPLITLLGLTVFQMTWVQNVTPNDRERLRELLYYAVISLFFSAAMAFHVVCMGITTLIKAKGVFLDDENLTNMHILLLGIAEILYRLHSISNNYDLISMYRNPPISHGERETQVDRQHDELVVPQGFWNIAMMIAITAFDAMLIAIYLF